MVATWRIIIHGGDMPRTSKNALVDLTKSHEITAGLIQRFKCPIDKSQAFLRDSKSPSLRIRTTKTGFKSFIFEAKLNQQTIRHTIGDVRSWSIDSAREEANKLRVIIDKGEDPREINRQKIEASIQSKKAKELELLTVGQVWEDYCNKRKPLWGELHYRDHINKSKVGGQPSLRRGMKDSTTSSGPLGSLMQIPLIFLTQEEIQKWALAEGKLRPTSARLAWRLLCVFLTWCSNHAEYASLVTQKNPAKSKQIRELLGKSSTKVDVLQREQLESWFKSVRGIQNPHISACLQILLLTGARLNEILNLKWEDINTQWKGIQINDKVEETRDIPLTPFVHHLLINLPKRNQWVFSSPTSENGRLSVPNTPHTRACRTVEIDGLSLHGLRRSFSSLSEWIEVPTGVVAQIMGHKPSATAEKHYKVRPLELLRIHHEKIECWILEQANVELHLIDNKLVRFVK